MICPKCETSEVWENDEKVAQGWKGPLRKCKDQECGWIQWPPKEKKAAPKFVKPAPEVTPPVPLTGSRDDDLVALYTDSLDRVMAKLKQEKLTDFFTSADIAAMTATLFIARSKG